ncbi:MAG: hypothetical protein ACI857_001270 [Arenicella sp.]|jgi:hypothetical protein
MVLLWSEDVDTSANETRRSILSEEKQTDSLGKTYYTMSQLRSAGPLFDDWYTPIVFRHPPADHQGEADPRHYTIERKEEYDHIPSLHELKTVWYRGSHYFNMNSKFKQELIGINWEMWMKYYVWYSTKEDCKAFR